MLILMVDPIYSPYWLVINPNNIFVSGAVYLVAEVTSGVI